MLQERLVIYLYYYAVFMVPVLSLFGLPAVYANLAMVFFIVLYSFSFNNKFTGINKLLYVAFCFYILLVIAHVDDYGSIINISAMLLVWLFIVFFVGTVFNEIRLINFFVETLPRFIVFTLIAYFFISILLSMVIPVENPISTILSGGRLKLLSYDSAGHSILIDLSFLGLVFAYAKISIFNGKVRFCAILFFISLLVLSRTTTAWVLILCSSLIFFIESVRFKANRVGIMLYIALTISFVFIFVNVNGFDFLLENIRTNFQGNDVSIYNDDLTAGRAELNILMVNGIEQSPIFGLGHGHPILQEGLQNADGFGAKTESGLRIATKYGIPFFIVILSIVLLPIRAFFSEKLQDRVLGISIPLGILCMLSSNSILEVPHGFGFLFYLPLSLIISEQSRC